MQKSQPLVGFYWITTGTSDFGKHFVAEVIGSDMDGDVIIKSKDSTINHWNMSSFLSDRDTRLVWRRYILRPLTQLEKELL